MGTLLLLDAQASALVRKMRLDLAHGNMVQASILCHIAEASAMCRPLSALIAGIWNTAHAMSKTRASRAKQRFAS